MEDQKRMEEQQAQSSMASTSAPLPPFSLPASVEVPGNMAMASPPPTLTEDTTSNSDPTNEKNEWMDVVHTKRLDCDTNVAYKTNMALATLPPDCAHLYFKQCQEKNLVVSLKPDQTYNIRVAAVNSLGVGPWSEVACYGSVAQRQTGILGGPTNIKITRTSQGDATLIWDPPAVGNCPNLEYCLYIEIESKVPNPSALSNYAIVYRGAARNCVVSRDRLAIAKLYQNDNRQIIMFRLAAILDGLEATTQVRWVQTLDKSKKSKEGESRQSKA